MRFVADESEESWRKNRPIVLLRLVQCLIFLVVLVVASGQLLADIVSGHRPGAWEIIAEVILILIGSTVLGWLVSGLLTWYHEMEHPDVVIARFRRMCDSGGRLPEISDVGLAGHYKDGQFYISFWERAGFHRSPKVIFSIPNGERAIKDGAFGSDTGLSEEDRAELRLLRRLRKEQPGPFQEVVQLLDGE